MSLDVYLIGKSTVQKRETIFIRENGAIREISREEWNSRFPSTEPVTVHINEVNDGYHANITHNLGKMAEAAGIYHALWRPDEIGIKRLTN